MVASQASTHTHTSQFVKFPLCPTLKPFIFQGKFLFVQKVYFCQILTERIRNLLNSIPMFFFPINLFSSGFYL
jgi:hypothetical protein